MDQKYHFIRIKAKEFNVIHDKTALDYLLKWSMKGQLQLATFSFNEPFESHKRRDFAKEFFTSPEVIAVISQILPSWAYGKEQVDGVDCESVPCTQTSMSFFDRVLDEENRIVRFGGNLHHCVDDVINDFMVSDELRKMILDENSDNYGLYNEEERRELLFRCFQHLILGGKWCQYEDKIDPYLDMTKMLYKDLVQVERNSDTKEIQVRTICLSVQVREKQTGQVILPRDSYHIQNFAYLMIDPLLRHVTLFAHEFGGQF